MLCKNKGVKVAGRIDLIESDIHFPMSNKSLNSQLISLQVMPYLTLIWNTKNINVYEIWSVNFIQEIRCVYIEAQCGWLIHRAQCGWLIHRGSVWVIDTQMLSVGDWPHKAQWVIDTHRLSVVDWHIEAQWVIVTHRGSVWVIDTHKCSV